MLSSQAHIKTASASRYLQQLCKHWSHKFTVEFTPQQGHIPFADGRSCDLAANDSELTLTVHAADREALTRTERVVIDHLKRFAFREDLGDVAWEPSGATVN